MRWRLLLPIALLVAAPTAGAAAPLRLLLLGDSITGGAVAGVGEPYAVQLADALGPTWDVTNIACGGSSSLDWRPDPGDILCGGKGFQLPNLYAARAQPALPADAVTVLLGTNDALGFFEPGPVDPADYGDALADLVFQLRADGAEHVLLMTPPPLFDDLEAELRIQAYRDEVLALCGGGTPGVWCGPDVHALLAPADFTVGNIHPRFSGHAKIADALYEDLAALVPVPEPGPLPLASLGLAWLARRRSGRTQAPR